MAVEAHDELLELLARYCECVDRYDLDGVAATFSDDATADYGPGRGGPVTGRQAIAARIASGQAEFERTHHQLGQSIFEPDADGVAALTYVTAHHRRWDGRLEVACLRYIDRLVRTDGGWRIADRRVEADVIDGFDGVAWRWTARRSPTTD